MKATARHYAESLLAAKAAGKRNAPELVTGLVHILRKKGESELLPKILHFLTEKEAEEKKVVNVVIETAVKAERNTEKELLKAAEKLYPGVKVEPRFLVNPDLKGGFRIRTKEKELDHSLNARLAQLRNHLA